MKKTYKTRISNFALNRAGIGAITGTVLGGGAGALSADPNASITDRVGRAAVGAGIGAATGYGTVKGAGAIRDKWSKYRKPKVTEPFEGYNAGVQGGKYNSPEMNQALDNYLGSKQPSPYQLQDVGVGAAGVGTVVGGGAIAANADNPAIQQGLQYVQNQAGIVGNKLNSAVNSAGQYSNQILDKFGNVIRNVPRLNMNKSINQVKNFNTAANFNAASLAERAIGRLQQAGRFVGNNRSSIGIGATTLGGAAIGAGTADPNASIVDRVGRTAAGAGIGAGIGYGAVRGIRAARKPFVNAQAVNQRNADLDTVKSTVSPNTKTLPSGVNVDDVNPEYLDRYAGQYSKNTLKNADFYSNPFNTVNFGFGESLKNAGKYVDDAAQSVGSTIGKGVQKAGAAINNYDIAGAGTKVAYSGGKNAKKYRRLAGYGAVGIGGAATVGAGAGIANSMNNKSNQ